MTDAPKQPKDALGADDYQRFMYACSHERRSPTTQRLIDASSYGWVYRFIREQGDGPESPPPGDGWLHPHDASPRKIAEYFGRVSLRVRRTDAFEYAVELESYFRALADSREFPRS